MQSFGYSGVSLRLTKKAPQSWIGRFNIVIGWGVSRYYGSVVQKWIGCRLMRSGVEACMRGY